MDTPDSRQKYESTIKQIADLPALPEVINKIMRDISLPETSAAHLAHIISYDPGLTSKFLRIVNSAAYGFQRQISSVQHAIMLLGFNTVRGVIINASVFKLFEKKHHQQGLDPNKFWKHAIETAIASRVLANKWKIRYAEDAFSAGMLHDIGKMILDFYFPRDYTPFLVEARRHKLQTHGQAFLDFERESLAVDHTRVGVMLGQRWKLPATFCEVIQYHHAPQLAKDAPELVYTVALANAFSHIIDLNFGVFNIGMIPQEVLDYFEYDPAEPEAFEVLYHEVAKEMEGVSDLIAAMRR